MTNPTLNQFRKLGSDFKQLRKLWPFLASHKGTIVAACFLIPVISLLQMGIPFILKRTVDQGVLANNFEVITWGSIAYLAVVLLEYAARASQTILTSRAVYQMVRSMRLSLIEHIMRLSARFHDRTMSGALVTRATSDFDNMNESLNQGVLSSVVDLAVLVGALVGLFLLNWKLASVTLIILPLTVMIIVFFSRALKHSMLLARVKIAALNAFTQECLYGSNTIKLLNAHQDSNQRFQKLAIEYRDAQMKSVVADAVLFALLDGVSSITIGIVLWLAVSQFHDSSALSAGVMIAFVQYIQNLFDPLKQLGNKIAMLQGAFTAIDRIFGIFETREFISGTAAVPGLEGTVEFKNVSFQYLPDQKTLHNVSFHLHQGQSLAIVGATGSGKSTIIKLLSKLYDGYEGSITVDGLDLREMNGQELRRHIAIVPQDIVIFHGTIAFNIGLGEEQTDLERIKSAAQFVGADRFIEQLPGGYDFIVREGGDNLSQGQRQLLAFARAIAKNPRIMILDEATSSVDPASETLIQQAIERIFTGRTLIVIAHRLSTIRKCDQIMVLDHGEVMEVGSHEELLARHGRYYELHQKMATEDEG
ncbi:ABC transporter ATP-binding protein [Oligoflexus tunisiensis]|uniref:ABC transporter ATP-binding protein n=1 Tax=Oligoflexus tunisiensis TaxID=708132 RepID=UPI000A704B44|nr:ABC transporter ATP-binding protein [Oligoflexus tunisiensis]